MALVLGVNSYATTDEADLYFEDRIDVAAWISADDDMKSQALVTATRYLDAITYAGYANSATQDLAWPRVGSFFWASRGRTIQFNKSYKWEELSTSNGTAFITALKALPVEIELVKKACFEQAYHFVNNDGVLDTSGGNPDSITIGSITLSGLKGSEQPERSREALNFIKPLLVNGGANLWFRAN